jgi:putative modified peptide
MSLNVKPLATVTAIAPAPKASAKGSPLPLPIAEKLLDRLSSDDDFRALFLKNPRAALSFVGYAEADMLDRRDGPWSCMACDGLPDKKTFIESREAFRKQLTTQSVQIIFKI